MRFRYSCTSFSELSAPASMAAWISAMVAVDRSKVAAGTAQGEHSTSPPRIQAAPVLRSNRVSSLKFSVLEALASQCRRGRWDLAVLRDLLVGVGQLEQRGLAEGPAEEFHGDGT